MIKGLTDGSADCECHRCGVEYAIGDNFPGDMGERMSRLASPRMILCGECGNKRCPKASDHRLACGNSNAPGQKGSIYG